MSENTNELTIQNENIHYNNDNEGDKSLFWIIVLFLIFRHVFSSVFLALLIAYILAPRKHNNDTSQEE